MKKYIIRKRNGTYLSIDKNGILSFSKNKTEAKVLSKNKATNLVSNNLKSIENEIDIIEQIIEQEEFNPEIKSNYVLSQELKVIKECSVKLNERYEFLRIKLKECDQEIIDIEHAMEFQKCNASQGYKLYKLMYNIRNKRREIKNEIEQIQIILNMRAGEINIEKVETLNTNQKEREYNPRVLKWLF